MPKATKGVASASSSSDTEDSLPARREERLDLALPAKLVYSRAKSLDETIPGVVVDLSASGAQVLTDQRFSLLLPPMRNFRLEIEFFLDELEIRQVPIQIVRVKKLKNYQLMLGCKFVSLPAAARLALRAEIGKRRSRSRSKER